jgi:hypothetical protein
VLFGTGSYSSFEGEPIITAQTSGRIGINVVSSAITNALHVVSTANPIRIVGLQPNTNYDRKVLVTDNLGVISYREDILIGSGIATITASATPPAAPQTNDIWIDLSI